MIRRKIKTKTKTKTKTKKEQDVKLIDYFYDTKNTKFSNLLLSTKKYKELYNSKEALLSLILSILSGLIWCYLFNSLDIEAFNQIINEITLNIFSALIGMLGFIISGLAILTGTINNKIIDKINDKKLIEHLISILYSFYFIGAFIGIGIFAYVFMYMGSFSNIIATNCRVFIISIVLSYVFCFSILYSIALLGTCLRIFLLGYKFSNITEEDKELDR